MDAIEVEILLGREVKILAKWKVVTNKFVILGAEVEARFGA